MLIPITCLDAKHWGGVHYYFTRARQGLHEGRATEETISSQVGRTPWSAADPPAGPFEPSTGRLETRRVQGPRDPGSPPANLPPMAFDEDVATVAMYPTVRHPMGMRMWRLNPGAGGPHVGVTVPTMVSGRPDIAGPGGGNSGFNHGGGWCNFYKHVGGESAKRERRRKNAGNKTFT